LLKSRLGELLAGRGQLVSLMGEAGLGKSRLMAELRKSTQSSSFAWLEGRSLSYQTSTPYAPFADMFGSYFGFGADDTDDEKYRKVKGQLTELMAERAEETAPFIGSLLGIKLPEDDSERVRYLDRKST